MNILRWFCAKKSNNSVDKLQEVSVNTIDDFLKLRKLLRKKYRNISLTKIQEMHKLFIQYDKCEYVNEKNEIFNLMRKEEHAPTLINILLSPSAYKHRKGTAAWLLSHIRSHNQDVPLSLALAIVDNELSESEKQSIGIALFELAPDMVPSIAVLKILFKSGYEEAALCLSKIDFPNEVLPELIKKLSDIVIKYPCYRTHNRWAFEGLCRIGEAARETVLSLLEQNELTEEQAKQAKIRFGLELEKEPNELEILKDEMRKMEIKNPEDAAYDIEKLLDGLRVSSSNVISGNFNKIYDFLINDFENHKKKGENYFNIHPGEFGLTLQMGKGYHFIARSAEDEYSVVLHRKY